MEYEKADIYVAGRMVLDRCRKIQIAKQDKFNDDIDAQDPHFWTDNRCQLDKLTTPSFHKKNVLLEGAKSEENEKSETVQDLETYDKRPLHMITEESKEDAHIFSHVYSNPFNLKSIDHLNEGSPEPFCDPFYDSMPSTESNVIQKCDKGEYTFLTKYR